MLYNIKVKSVNAPIENAARLSPENKSVYTATIKINRILTAYLRYS